jgi:hypothetical protein
VPWRVKRLFYLYLLAFVIGVCSLVVFIRHTSEDSNLLAVIGVAGGIAVLIVALPSNGHDDDD